MTMMDPSVGLKNVDTRNSDADADENRDLEVDRDGDISVGIGVVSCNEISAQSGDEDGGEGRDSQMGGSISRSASRELAAVHQVDEEVGAADPELGPNLEPGQDVNLDEDNLPLEEDELDEAEEVKGRTKEETLRVKVWRAVVVMFLLASGAMVGTFSYVYLRAEDDDDYRSAYDKFCDSIRDSSLEQLSNLLDTAKDLSEFTTAQAFTFNSTFPFVTMPMFEVRGAQARNRSGIEYLVFAPLVPGQMRREWEKYSVSNSWWVAESQEIRRNKTVLGTPFDSGMSISQMIYERDEMDWDVYRPSPDGREVYKPLWQESPPQVRPFFVNLNVLGAGGPFSEQRELDEAMMSSKESLFSSVFNTSGVRNFHNDAHLSLHTPFLTKTQKENGGSPVENPHFFMFTPVFRYLDFQVQSSASNEVVGQYISTIQFDRYFANLLPDGVNGIYCVLENNCGQMYTYELVGSLTNFIGEGDFHDREFDDTEVTIPFYDFQYPDVTPNIKGHCVYQFRVYASQTFKDEYDSLIPEVFTATMAFTFCAMAVSFFVYDGHVRRRNTKVVDVAVTSNAIVASMFPSTIRGRLLFKEVKSRRIGSTAAPLQGRSREDIPGNDINITNQRGPDHPIIEGSGVTNGVFADSKPLVDLYPHTTIMFGAMVGFTAWSSTREASLVFSFLETLYAAFDEIARRRRVFKVETVGDCYVACCGLPTPREHHAVVMAIFSLECMVRMRKLVRDLEPLLGPGTSDLSMRIGLHSGAVTAGVLRGERSRFQLFGDTMNTASRVETNGMQGRVHVSQETADLLIRAGKESWIRPREGAINAKGKGKMQTFWLNLDSVSRV